jgi:hypothetical protein
LDVNPYVPPQQIPEAPAEPSEFVRGPGLLSFEWTAVLLFNTVVPTLFAWSMTSSQAKIGCAIAVVTTAVIGYLFCWLQPGMMLLFIRGGTLVAISQVFPAIQVICGIFALQSLILVGLIPNSSFPDMLDSTLAGFLVTFLCGFYLLAVSFGVGSVLRMLTPARWWLIHKSRKNQDT